MQRDYRGHDTRRHNVETISTIINATTKKEFIYTYAMYYRHRIKK